MRKSGAKRIELVRFLLVVASEKASTRSGYLFLLGCDAVPFWQCCRNLCIYIGHGNAVREE